MKGTGKRIEAVLVVGNTLLTQGIIACLSNGGCKVSLVSQVSAIGKLQGDEHYDLAILVTKEDLAAKQLMIEEVQSVLAPRTPIAINMESIGLDQLQRASDSPHLLLGLNWTEPADLTYFLEIIVNDTTDDGLVEGLLQVAVEDWQKDPYVIRAGHGIRMPLLAAMIREAFYLVSNGYATVQDIDRACRNDAGYYLPYAGNLRYMDLMGTYAYGMVMKDLNPELSTDLVMPQFFQQMMDNKEWGMETGKGFYEYSPSEGEQWKLLLKRFSHQVKELIDKYPFGQEELPKIDPLPTENHKREHRYE
ncbi:3-hydroxybutyryl-CoA dehydrogenase [Dyadobacter jejuensis]|uniref:3-hydroxybutyryl-CoA dehydrogenase n=1 Tax=Dyadobacter jejuensis TaxID=1082580 RepID=A0A316B6E7_9BACT|nr:3-hydroxyacyl-CoA dehydrogenase family protein [Dyadobacter jejuensis]PWJ58167.1 3-hydroxybutyryl-CoA dehydrogenase [Dyadobacter jejuensis]